MCVYMFLLCVHKMVDFAFLNERVLDGQHTEWDFWVKGPWGKWMARISCKVKGNKGTVGSQTVKGETVIGMDASQKGTRSVCRAQWGTSWAGGGMLTCLFFSRSDTCHWLNPTRIQRELSGPRPGWEVLGRELGEEVENHSCLLFGDIFEYCAVVLYLLSRSEEVHMETHPPISSRAKWEGD